MKPVGGFWERRWGTQWRLRVLKQSLLEWMVCAFLRADGTGVLLPAMSPEEVLFLVQPNS